MTLSLIWFVIVFNAWYGGMSINVCVCTYTYILILNDDYSQITIKFSV